MPLAFGQPVGGICQFAYAVEDIERSAERFTRELGVGPWFVRGPFQPPEGRYRGEPTETTFTLARGFTGHVMVELVKQHDDSPSVYNENGASATASTTGRRSRRTSTRHCAPTSTAATRRRSTIACRPARVWSTWTRRASCPA